MSRPIDRVLAAVDAAADEAVAFTAELVRIPTVNPPGAEYDPCARAIGGRLRQMGFEVEYLPAAGRPEHSAAYPRLNVIGTRRGVSDHPLLHLNGHLDVVPTSEGWTVDPFGGSVKDGRLYGRGACDMKAGIAAAIYAADAIRRAGVRLAGTLEISGTVDEESGGFAGVAWLAECGRIAAARTDYVIIPEPMNVDRICIGHRGAYWFEIATRGRTAHGGMPFLGVNAVEHMAVILDAFRRELVPALTLRRTAMPVVPDAARHGTLNVSAVAGGQPVGGPQTPCVPDRCRAVFDRRFLIEEGFEATRAEIVALLERIKRGLPDLSYELTDLLVIHPVRTAADSPVISVLGGAVEHVLGCPATLVASPGSYDHKHVTRIGGIEHCVAYGPGVLDVAHQPDEWCAVDDLVTATKVLALAILDLVGTAS